MDGMTIGMTIDTMAGRRLPQRDLRPHNDLLRSDLRFPMVDNSSLPILLHRRVTVLHLPELDMARPLLHQVTVHHQLLGQCDRCRTRNGHLPDASPRRAEFPPSLGRTKSTATGRKTTHGGIGYLVGLARLVRTKARRVCSTGENGETTTTILTWTRTGGTTIAQWRRIGSAGQMFREWKQGKRRCHQTHLE